MKKITVPPPAPLCTDSTTKKIDSNSVKITELSPTLSVESSPDIECGALPPKNELLTALWRSPELCHQISVVNKRTSNKFSNISVKDADEAVQRAQKFSGAGFDVYFPCAEYFTPNNRRADNVSGACGFWLDIDCGAAKWTAGKGYPTVEDAEEAIQRFCNDIGLPSPTHIVNSGYGLHVYWVFDRALDRELWQAYARKLKALANYLKFLVDNSRTSDIASVLRIPGTLNYKYDPPRPVTQRYASGELIEQKSMLNAIDKAYDTLCCQVTVSSSTKTFKLELQKLTSALKVLDPDCDEAIWKLRRLAPLARAASEHPELLAQLFKLARDWSSGALGGKPSKAWNTPGTRNGLTGKAAFEQEWKRFINPKYSGNPTTIATIYHDAKEAGWVYTAHPGTTDDSLDPLATIQQQYGIINIGGKLCIFDRYKIAASAGRPAQKLDLSNKSDGSWMIECALEAQFQGVDSKKIIKEFLRSPNTICYEGLEFNPIGTSYNYLNLWVGPTIIPKAGEWKLIKLFLRYIICGGDNECYQYLIRNEHEIT